MARSQKELAPVDIIFPEIDAGSRLAIVASPDMEEIAKDSALVSDVLATRPRGSGRVPGFLEVTDPVIDAEPLRPSQNPTLGGGDLTQHVNTSGRCIDISLSHIRGKAGGGGTSSVHKLAILDEALMPGLAGMEGEIARAERNGSFSTYWPLCRRMDEVTTNGSTEYRESVRTDTDNYYVCTPSNDGSDWVVRSIIAGDEAHTQDGLILRTDANERTGKLDSQPEEFVDYLATKLALGELPSMTDATTRSVSESRFAKEFMRVGDADNKESQKLLTAYIGAVAKTILDPSYDYQKDPHLTSSAKSFIARVLPSILENDSRLGSPAHPYLRAAAELESLGYFEESGRLTKQGKKGLQQQRARLLQSMVSAQGYQAIIGKADKVTEYSAAQIAKLNSQGYTFPTQTGPMLRFEVISYDTMDSLIGAQALTTLSRMTRINPRGLNPTLAALQGVLEQIKPRVEKRQRRMIVQANGSNKLRPYSGLTSRSIAGPDTDMISFDGSGVPHQVWGHYPHEIAGSLRRPYDFDPRFGNSGIAMPGIAAMFEAVTEAGNVRCIIFSAKQMPWCITKALHERTHGSKRKVTDIRDALNGEFRIIEELERTREQAWRIGELVSDGVELLPERLTNGSAYAIVADRSGKISSDFGTIRGEKPRKRNHTSARETSRGDIPLPQYRGGAEPIFDGLVRNDDGHAVYEIRCADGGIFTSSGKSFGSFAINAQVTRPFVSLQRVPRRR